MKKLLSAALALLLAAGCSSSPAASSAAPAGNESAGGKTEIEFWYAGGKTVVDLIQKIVDEYNGSQDAYFVKTVTQADYTETFQKLQAGIAGKAAPDIVLLDTAPARMLYEKQLVADLRPLQEADPNYNADDYFAVYADQATYDDGGIFARPMYGTIQICYYNIEAFEKAGIDPTSIKSWQDMAEAGKKIVAEGYDFGWEPMGGDGKNLIDAAFANGAKVLSDDGKTVLINSPEWVEVWESFRQWIHDDKIMTTHWGGQGWEYWYATIDDVIEGKAGGYTGSPADAPDLDFSIVQPMEQPGWNGNVSMPWAQALMLSILEGSSDAEKQGAYDFMNYLTNPENHAAFLEVSGYAAVNKKVSEVESYKKYMEENPVAAVLLKQSEHAAVYPVDPTGGAILDALNIAASKIEVDGVSAQEALDEAQKNAQTALDEALGG
ncbi:MAG: extracellular solute-binding protein [Solobacterium sp.]|nr:extracellular solute-binding protein [Solobacterium sp.]